MTPQEFFAREQALAFLMGAIPQQGNFGWGISPPTGSKKATPTAPRATPATPKKVSLTATSINAPMHSVPAHAIPGVPVHVVSPPTASAINAVSPPVLSPSYSSALARPAPPMGYVARPAPPIPQGYVQHPYYHHHWWRHQQEMAAQAAAAQNGGGAAPPPPPPPQSYDDGSGQATDSSGLPPLTSYDYAAMQMPTDAPDQGDNGSDDDSDVGYGFGMGLPHWLIPAAAGAAGYALYQRRSQWG